MGEKEVLESLLGPSQITEIEGIKLQCEISSAAVISEILKGLAALKRSRTPAEKHAAELANILGQLNKEFLLEAAEALKLDLSTWIPPEELALKLALKMIGCGLEVSTPTIMSIRGRLTGRRREQVQLIIDLIASSWVDCKAATTLPRVAFAHQGECVALNAFEELTARMYVNVAGLLHSERLPNDPWQVPGVSGVLGEITNPEEVPPQLVASINSALRTALCVRQKEDLVKVLKHQTSNEPVFLALPTTSGVSRKWLKDLQDIFPGVTFFLLLGNQALKDAGTQNDKIVVLEPLLAAGCEDAFCSAYRDKHEYIMRRCND